MWFARLRRRFWSRPRPIADAVVALLAAALLGGAILWVTEGFTPVRRWLTGLVRTAWRGVAPGGHPPLWLLVGAGLLTVVVLIQLLRTRR